MRKSKMDHRSSTEFSSGVPVSTSRCFAPHGFHGLRVLRLAVLDVLRLVERDGVKLQPAILFRVAADQRVARHARCRCAAISSKRACRSGPCNARTFSSGVNFFASATQLKTRLVGQTIKCGLRIADCGLRPAGCGASIGNRQSAIGNVFRKASVCSVFPKPISSARMPPKPFARRKCSHATPCFW